MAAAMGFGELLRRYREAAGLSQEALAERAGLTANGVGALERGERQRPYPHTVRTLADALELTPAERITLTNALRVATAAPLYPRWRDRLDRWLAPAWAALDPAAARAAWDAGAALGDEAACADALAPTPPR